MCKFYTVTILSFFLLCSTNTILGQNRLVSDVQRKQLDILSAQSTSTYLASHQKALALAKAHGWPLSRKTKTGGLVLLQGVNSLGFPVYLTTFDNIIAAGTTQTNTVQPGGSLGLNLSGSSAFLANKLAIWDGGEVYKAHQEFAGKTITLEDKVGVLDHATHVAGTMIAKGVYPPAKGMAFNATTLHSYYFDNDVSKMSAAASGLLLSNHSYGDEAGWNFNDSANHWEWWGLPGDSVDYTFGFYDSRTQQFDQIAFNAPYYLIVESAGNARGYPGPDVGGDYYGYRSRSDQTFVDKGKRPATISSQQGYDNISTTGNAKNILTVGAVNPLPNGPANSSDITTTFFSSWGPTDDGRVKPDIVGDGLNVTSSGSASPTNYITLSGTSMSAPNVTGSLYLLQEYYAKKNGGSFMLASTLKGLACHTAFDAGNAGPDYIFGWGLLDMKRAAQAIIDNGTKSLVKEAKLLQGQPQTYNVIASGAGPLSATISWTDPAGTPGADGIVNNRKPKLVNDLDIRISDGTTTFLPWILDPANPSAPATKGDNIVDNVEQVFLPSAVLGRSYTVTVTNKGTLKADTQRYSIIITGIGGHSYCASAPVSDADSRVDHVKLANLDYNPPAGCTTYSDHTDKTIQLEQGKTYPLSVTLGTCGANFNKAAKIFIDWNGNGTFEANELVATTNVMAATGTYTTNITVPLSVIPDNFSLMRIVLTETSDTSAIKSCGSYAKGETQDYQVQFLQSTTDAGITAINYPTPTGSCPALTQVTLSIKNFGSRQIGNIPVKVTVTAADGTITHLDQVYTAALAPQEEEKFILNTTFNAVAGATYTIAASTNLANDVITSNDQVTESIVISSPPQAVNLAAYYCTNNKNYQLSGSGDGELLWYQNQNDAIPFAFGSPVSVTQAPVNNTYYAGLNDFKGTIGPATKSAFTGGGYNQFTPYINVSTRIPLVIESARLYVGNSGKIIFDVTDSNGQIVSTSTIDAVATRTTPGAGGQVDDPNDKGAVYTLNLLLPAAGTYTISTTFDNNSTLFRNNAGVTGYPFTVGDVFSIDGNSAQSGSDTTYYKGFYYYFYDIKLKSAGCASDSRASVQIAKPVITQNGTTLSSNFATGNQWYLAGAPINGETGETFMPTKSGNYTVGVTLGSGCQALSDNFVYVLTSGQGTTNEIGLVIYPVPASDQMNILFAAPAKNNLTLSLINAVGKQVYTSDQTVQAGNFSTIINVADQPPGSYVLKVLLGQKAYYTKVVIGR